jgi:hypothetical protein
VWVPEDGVGVEVRRGVEPEHELLLPSPPAVAEDVGVQQVRLAARVAQELKVHLVVTSAARADLHITLFIYRQGTDIYMLLLVGLPCRHGIKILRKEF